MRILHMFTNPHLTNGATVFEYRVSELLKNRGIYFDYLVTEEATEEELKRYKNVNSVLYKLPIDKKHGLLIREIKINYQYYKFFKTHKYNLVYADTENALRAIHLLMARLAGVPVRVVHSHNTGLQSQSKIARVVARCLRGVFRLSATDYFACSDLAAEWLFPKSIYKKHNYTILKNGVDLKQFKFNPRIREELRSELGLTDSVVIGNIGRFMPQKNHKFLLDIFKNIMIREPSSKLLLIGDGPLKEEIEKYTQALNLNDSVIFLGNVSNVSDYLQVMDLFLMPSLFEGLPITGIEAQAASLLCVFSDTITKELAITKLAHYISLEETSEFWALRILELLNSTSGRQDVEKEIIDTGYSINETVDWLEKFYRSKTLIK